MSPFARFTTTSNRGVRYIDNIYIDISIIHIVKAKYRQIWKISISLREFCKLLISIKFCNDQDLSYRTPLTSKDGENPIRRSELRTTKVTLVTAQRRTRRSLLRDASERRPLTWRMLCSLLSMALKNLWTWAGLSFGLGTSPPPLWANVSPSTMTKTWAPTFSRTRLLSRWTNRWYIR